MTMISFPIDGGVFNYRVGAVILDQGHVLLCRDQQKDWWFLPGGRCELLESSLESVRREIREELDSDCQVERLLCIAENFFELDGARFHEIALYYLVSLPPNSPLFEKSTPRPFLEAVGTTMETHWFPVAGLNDVRLYPEFLRESLNVMPETPVHLIIRDEEPKGNGASASSSQTAPPARVDE